MKSEKFVADASYGEWQGEYEVRMLSAAERIEIEEKVFQYMRKHGLDPRKEEDYPIVYDRGLSLIKSVTKDGKPIKTLSRWMDGAYPSRVDPIAVWETKEYYDTTTFGSRVADGVYETMLDGYELLELESLIGRKIKHYLIIDDRFTWWTKGKSYRIEVGDQ